ncbi:MAG: FecR domain-containing protein [Gammaproteobacteria bacterium]
MNVQPHPSMSGESATATAETIWPQAWAILLLSMALALFSLPSQAQSNAPDVAGRVIMSFGKVLLVPADGNKRLLKRGDLLRSGDRVITQGSGYAQVRYRDGALMSIRPGTDFRIDEFHFEGRQDGQERSFFSVLKGGLRTITGLIGKKNKLNYRVSTPIATIGIRGTHYGMRLCGASDCLPAEALEGDGGAAQAADPGLYVEVKQGATAVSNSAGEQVFGAGQNYYVANQSAQAEGSLAPFGFVFDKYAASEDQEENEPQEDAPPADESDATPDQGENEESAAEGGDQERGDGEKGGPGQSEEGESGTPADQAEQGGAEQGGAEQGGAQSGQAPGDSSSNAGAPGQSPAASTDGANSGSVQPVSAQTSQSPPSELGASLNLTASVPAQTSTLSSGAASTVGSTVAAPSTVNNDEETAIEATEVSNTRSAIDGAIGFLALTPNNDTGVVAGGRHDNDSYKLLIGTEAAGSGENAILQAQAIRSEQDGGQFRSETADLAELGNLSNNIYWGRWVDGWETKGVEDSAFSAGIGNAHFIYSEQATSDAELAALSGEATFYLRPASGSTPTHVDGREGSQDHASLRVDFATGEIKGLRIDVSVDNDRYTGKNSANASLSDAMFSGMDLEGECLGCSGGELALEGNAKLGFVNDAATADLAILGFGLGSADRTEGVLGTAVLDQLSQSDGGTGSVALMAFEVETAGAANVEIHHSVRLEDNGADDIIEITTIDGAGNIVTRLAAPDGANTDEWQSGLAKLEDVGGNSIGINWGRWDDNWRYQRTGTSYKPRGAAHFAYTDKATTSAQLAAVAPTIGGAATFNHIGGPAPTDGDGITGAVNSWQFNVDFGSSDLNVSGYQFNATVNGRTMDISQTGNMPYSQALTDNIQLTGTCNGGCGTGLANGEASLQLVGSQASHAISAVTAHDTSGSTSMNAVGAFSR